MFVSSYQATSLLHKLSTISYIIDQIVYGYLEIGVLNKSVTTDMWFDQHINVNYERPGSQVKYRFCVTCRTASLWHGSVGALS